MRDINSVLKEALRMYKPSGQEIKEIEKPLRIFMKGLDEAFKKKKTKVQIFIGGSFAKKTLVKGGKYDIDIFLRFDGKYKNSDISEMACNALNSLKNISAERIHGSRDYFRIDLGENFYFEIIPVISVSRPKDTENITDLSYYHVKYTDKKLKNTRIIDEIILAKAFCRANRVYGAESHIKGFSGYSLELLLCNYKTFLRFIKEISKSKKGEKIIIDIEKHYKNKNQIMMDMNSSKTESPIILVDPTYKQRNALATLSDETLDRFRAACKKFLKSPDIKFFIRQKADFDKPKAKSESRGEEFAIVEISTDVQEGAIAGSKLLKFYRLLFSRAKRFFEVKDSDFYYEDGKTAKFFISAKKREKEIIPGPPLENRAAVESFRKAHKKTVSKDGRIYAEEKIAFSLKEFIESWPEKNRKTMKDMYLTEIKVLQA